jgi:hypothetical protein
LEEQVPSLPNDAWDWLDRAEKTRKAAEQESDRKTKEEMLQFAHLYLHFAQAAAALAWAQFALITRADPPN